MCFPGKKYLSTTIGKKQVVAITGLMLIGFLVAHLAGNFLIYAGPKAFNEYAAKLTALRPGLLVAEFGLLAIFVFHLALTALIVKDNRKARGSQYAVAPEIGQRSWAARSMKFTGPVILVFVIFHLLDFTFAEHQGEQSIIHGTNYGLYGLVYNSFLSPLRSSLYIVAMIAIGLHVSHGLQSFFQTFGLMNNTNEARIKKVSVILGYIIGLGFSSIPIYVMIDYLVLAGG